MKVIKDTPDRLLRDWQVCAGLVANIEHCPGGRPVVHGYICPHCNSDTGLEGCREPLEGYEEAAKQHAAGVAHKLRRERERAKHRLGTP